MNNSAFRIKELRKNLGLSQEEFGGRLGVTKGSISRIENSYCGISNQIESSICREFGVNREWIRQGTGDMYEELSKEEKVASILGTVFSNDGSKLYELKMSVFEELGKLSESDWEVIQRIIDGIKRG